MKTLLTLASSRPFSNAHPSHDLTWQSRQPQVWFRNRLMVGLVALLLSGFVPIGQIAMAAPGDSGAAPSASFAEGTVEADIDTFWRQIFATDTLDYWSPAVVPVSGSVDSGCGYVAPDQYLAFYCSVDVAVYWSISGYDEAFASSGDAAWINIMAHEWSHHVQLLLGINTPWRQTNDSVSLELEATCMGGAYVANAQNRGLVDDAMIASMVGMFGGSAMHGSTEQVRSAFWNGIENGIAGCGVAL